MYRVTCQQCGASAITDNGALLQAAVACRCCTQDHDHQEAADSCPGAGHQHTGASCTAADPQACVAVTEAGQDCPGGHCGLGVDGCTVCRPLRADWLGVAPLGQTPMLPAALMSLLHTLLLSQLVLRAVLTLMALANATDRNTGGNNLVNKLVQALYSSSTSFTITPGTSGGSAFTITPPFKLRLMTAQGSDTANGTEQSATGYTAGGNSLGSSAFGTPSGGVATNNNAVSWTAGAAWSAVVAIEIWDTAATPLRYLQGSITSITLGNGNTLQFAAGSITFDASAW